MKKSNLKISLTTIVVTCLVLIPIFSSFTIMRDTPQINVEVRNNLKVSQAEIFDGMIVNYTFNFMGSVMNSGFSYVYDSGTNFDVTWWIEGPSFTTWVEDASNRLISMSAGAFPFDDGSHAPIWIFTNVSLYDIVLISVDGDGDHPFNITKEKIFNIPGYGSVEVWQLEDLAFPGGIAWYEKSIGILITGNFLASGGNYDLGFVDTNAVFSNVPPVSGLFDGLYMDYNMSGSGISFAMDVKYSGYSVNTYNHSGELIMFPNSDWTEDTTTRLMYNVNGSGFHFETGQYTPYWIFTNVSLNDIVMMAVDADGDHSFQVKESLNLEYGSFGPISLWKLEDLSFPSGFACYEKNTGILVYATFVYTGDNYSYELLDTNANFGHLLPFAFTLSSNATDPDTDGIFDLEWTAEFAKNYSIYEYSSYITAINGSLTTLVDETTNMAHPLSGYSTGIYYFIAVAKNNYGITISNCIIVTVGIPSGGGGIPGYGTLFFVITLLSISVLIFKKWKTHRAVE